VDDLRTNTLLLSGDSYMRTDPRLTIAPSSLKSKVNALHINWMILRR